MNIHLKTLLKDWPCTVHGGLGDEEVVAVTEHSTHVVGGSLFIARKGKVTDGLCYVDEAIENGAVAIVTDRLPEHDPNPLIPLIVVADCLRFLAYAAATLAGNPAEVLNIIAITGTNGKTTVAHYIGQILLQAGRQVAVIGTVGIYINGERQEENVDLTTLTAERLHAILKDCVEKGVTDVVMEASSMGLAQNRLAYCPIDIGVLLNIGEDHYEEHGGKKPYLMAKQKLVDEADTLFVNGTSVVCKQMSAHRKEYIFFFTPQQFEQYPVAVQDRIDRLISEAHHFPENIAAALAVANFLQLPIAPLELHWPEGRMERIDDEKRTVYIDYAHTPEALENALSQLKSPKKSLKVVLGCGGGRDQQKRAKMGKVASQFADQLYITSDNPRYEQAEDIIKDIMQGVLHDQVKVVIEVDREKAIHAAIREAEAGDIIFIAGKGHEQFQQIASINMPFSDRLVAQEALYKYA